jgi:mRNA interferase RelE/StbE
MTYSIEWERNSLDEINGLPKELALRIYDKINEAKENPEHYLEKLKGMPEFKIRIGDYRVILLWLKQEHLLKIQAISHRKNIYKKYKTE